MTLSEKIWTRYLTGKGYTSSLNRFVTHVMGQPYYKMSRRELDAIGNSKRYIQWNKLQKVEKMVKKRLPLQTESLFNRSHKDPTHVSSRKIITHLINTGHSLSTNPVGAQKKSKFGRAKIFVGKRAFKPLQKGQQRYRQATFSTKRIGRTKTVRALKRGSEFKGRVARQLFSHYIHDEDSLNMIIMEIENINLDEPTNKPKFYKKVKKYVKLKQGDYYVGGPKIEDSSVLNPHK